MWMKIKQTLYKTIWKYRPPFFRQQWRYRDIRYIIYLVSYAHRFALFRFVLNLSSLNGRLKSRAHLKQNSFWIVIFSSGDNQNCISGLYGQQLKHTYYYIHKIATNFVDVIGMFQLLAIKSWNAILVISRWKYSDIVSVFCLFWLVRGFLFENTFLSHFFIQLLNAAPYFHFLLENRFNVCGPQTRPSVFRHMNIFVKALFI